HLNFQAGKRPPRPALWWVSGTGQELKWNFRELSEISQQAANVLSGACGLQRGDRVAVVLPQVPEWWLVTLGCFRTGLVFMPGTIQMKSTDILYRLQSSKARAIVAGDEVAQEVDAVAPDCSFLKIKLLVSEKSREGWLNFKALLKFSSRVEIKTKESETVQKEKQVPSVNKDSFQRSYPQRTWTGLDVSDTMWTISDTGWIVNILASFLEPWSLGACTFVHLLPKFDPQTVLKGLTCRVSKTMTVKPGSLGTAMPHYDVQVIDEHGNVLPPGKQGDIAIRVKPIRPVGIFSGYLDNPKKTEANIRGDFWLLGDRGIKDPEGYFHFLGRTDDIINSSGYRIGPSEVENALMEHPAVVETAVVKAFVVLAPEFLSHDPDQLTKLLQQHVKSVTAPYKYPRKVEFVLDLPKTIVGKIDRKKLRAKEWKTSGQAQA
ncbi:hypothetical protein A6R68_08675, partial [Neotoma lepida]